MSTGEKLAEAVKTEVARPDFGLRVIIVWKCVKAALVTAVGITALALMHDDLHELGVRAVAWLGIDPARPTVVKVLAALTGLTPGRIALIGTGALIYACVLALQAWGLHRRRVWAEWLTVIVTSSLIPIEIYELASHATLGKGLALVANLAIVVYLLRHRWLFVPGRIGRWLKARRRARSAGKARERRRAAEASGCRARCARAAPRAARTRSSRRSG
ncbi:MAG: DUF2127 domain-containing protein [Deltaproteobacteria bacterium]|nr:DUF2127 domain-containing protein [Deltaproteobacteria bacterium]